MLTRRSLRLGLLAAVVPAVLLVAAARPAVSAKAPVPELAGTYEGTYTDETGAESGTLHLDITSQKNRSFRGTLQPDRDATEPGPVFNIHGSISAKGRINAVAKLPGQPAVKFVGLLSEDGNTISGAFKLKGTGERGAFSVTRTFPLPPAE